MTSIFQRARQSTDEQPEESANVFKYLKAHKQENIIPPVGIADPELVESFMQNLEDEEKIKRDIADVEAYKRESPIGTFMRQELGHGARALEGLFGGVTSFLNMLSPEMVLESEEGEVERFQGANLPTAHKLHEFTKEKTGKYLEPKGELSKATQETASDIGSMFSTPGLSLYQKILGPIGGQLIKQTIKSSGGSEKAQDYGKLGFMALSTMANLGNAPKVAAMAYNDAINMIPRGLSFTARPTVNALNQIKNSPWYVSGVTPSKAPAFKEIQRIENAIQNNMIDGQLAMQIRRDINEARKELGGFSFNQPADKKAALKYLGEVDKALIASMENYGTRVNPTWWKNYNLANEAVRITHRSKQISDFISKYAKPLQSDTAKTLFHLGGTAAAIKSPLLATTAVPVLAAGKSVQVINRMIRSPILRNHYLNVMKAASVGNAAVMKKELEKFDIVARKLEEQSKTKENQSPEM